MSDDQFKDKETQVFKDEEEILLDHNYDGIKELDNPLPMWWLWTFFGAIIFSFVYFIHYHLDGGGLSLDQSVAIGMQGIDKQREQAKSQVKTLSHDEFLALAKDQARVEKGKAVFGTYCISCHGDQGQGNIGPNLTDNFWKIPEVDLSKISSVIRGGVPNTSMAPWGTVLDSEQIEDVTVFVHSLKGTNPANAKQPEGTDQG